jgi:hypothetical protein
MPDGAAVRVAVAGGPSSVGCKANFPCTIPVPDAKLWSPEDPYLCASRPRPPVCCSCVDGGGGRGLMGWLARAQTT